MGRNVSVLLQESQSRKWPQQKTKALLCGKQDKKHLNWAGRLAFVVDIPTVNTGIVARLM